MQDDAFGMNQRSPCRVREYLHLCNDRVIPGLPLRVAAGEFRNTR